MFREFLAFSQQELDDEIEIFLGYADNAYYLLSNNKYFTTDIGFKPTAPIFYDISTDELTPVMINFNSAFKFTNSIFLIQSQIFYSNIIWDFGSRQNFLSSSRTNTINIG